MKNPFILTLLLFIIGTSCNEDFWGYNYEAPPLVKVTKIQGNLTDKYSGKPVHPATITINGQETMTDENGNYLLNYIIPEDIEPNQTELGYMNIIAPDYLVYNTSFIIYPVENTVDVELEYALPIIINAISHGDTTQAIVKDYQGVQDLFSITVTFNEPNIFGEWKKKEFEMNRVGVIDNYTVYLDFIVLEEEVLNLNIIENWFRITATDNSANIGRRDFSIEPDSSLIF